MFTRIVVPLDGTRFAEAALAPARSLARTFAAHVVLVRAVSPSGLPRVAAPEGGASHVDLDTVDDADGYLNEVTQHLRDAGYQASFYLFIAEPGAGVARTAELAHADLIVMATHQRWTLDLTRGDSTTLQVLARSRVPILAWRPGAPLEPEGGVDRAEALLARPEAPIVVPLDGSVLAESALPVAAEFARAYNSSLVLVRAVGHGAMRIGHAGLVGGNEGTLSVGDVVLREAQSYLDQVVENLTSRGVHASAVAREGTAPSIINAIWRERDAALVILASHGSRGKSIGFLGSVAGAMVEESEAPVLVVHP